MSKRPRPRRAKPAPRRRGVFGRLFRALLVVVLIFGL
ncbi:MAG: hypothetical protein JWQ52_1299, partial [Phenylobacterium sp.]|nr:hypothetical protein [Phenylobacterium sp.]